MRVNWRQIHAARNSYAVLSAACETEGIVIYPVDLPANDVTCYSLNSINEPNYRDEIAHADCITIVGGPHATACYRSIAQYADYVVVGEGEHTLPRLLNNLESGGDGHIPGVATREYYEPARTTVRLDAYPAFSVTKGYIEISRGCPYSCGYCQTPQIFGHCMRHRSIDAIVTAAGRHEQARFVTPNAFAYGSDGIHPRFNKVCNLLKRIRAVGCQQVYFGTFPSEVRPEFVCHESLALVTDYCTNTKLHFGAQSGSNAVLAQLHRGHMVEMVIDAVTLCHDTGITPIVDFIVGFPFETDEDQEKTAELIAWVAQYGLVHAHRFMSLPGTPLAGSRARSLLPETEKLCGKLALAGKLTGSWNEPEIRFMRSPSTDKI
ncbi:MAG: TIGR04013 family B12-binding domain/radical SAM domain-containing protein [Methanoregula sp.]|nr:TIGR04013 family B12-binding domain/radical SAM domain-containing protein [Methanoregula sp.]